MTEFVRMDGSIKDAILTIMEYIKAHTGVEPTQDEVADLLKSYFILNEIGNQIQFQLKKEETRVEGNQLDARGPLWTLNLISGPGQNILARAGVFHRGIKEAIDGTRQYMKKTIGTDPGYEVIARSLKSSFILSEIKNQLDYQRKLKQNKKAIKKSNTQATKT